MRPCLSGLRATLLGSCLLASGTFAMSPRPATAAASSALPAAASQLPFPDFGFMAPPGQYTGPVFRLSQDYPAALPGADRMPAFFQKLPAVLSPDFSFWRDYMLAVRDYCLEGNIAVDWRVQDNPVRAWYHIPWQHYGPGGREGIRGLTKEAPVQPGQLAPGQGQPNPNDFYQTYAVGFYNDFAGYTIGRVWADHQNPDLAVTNRPGGFPVGSVVSKLLFVDVPVEQVPSLVNPIQWQGYIQKAYRNPDRAIRSLALIQMDIAVRDERAPGGWFFGTFQYNGALNRPDPWQNLVPVGIMWGNDPGITDDAYTNPKPTVTRINPNLRETSINPDPAELPPTHLGWNGRLNGPVDNPVSSCMSCHMTAEVPTRSPLNPTFQANPPAKGSPAWMRWFQNLDCGIPFDSGSQSTDYSLQLAIGIENFLLWKAPAQSGLFAQDYETAPPRVRANANGKRLLHAAPARPRPEPRSFPIVRDLIPGEDGL